MKKNSIAGLIVLGLALLLTALGIWLAPDLLNQPGGWVALFAAIFAGLSALFGGKIGDWAKTLFGEPASKPALPIIEQNITTVSGGTVIGQVENYHEAAQPPEIQASIGAIPAANAQTYISRGPIEQNLADFLRSGQSGAIVGVHAPGGVGKTELAKKTAETLKDVFEKVFWVDVGENDAPHVVINMLIQAGLPVRASYAEQRSDLQAHLMQHRYLVILDDVRQGALPGLPDLLPPRPCAALITSRIQQMRSIHCFELDRMTPDEARALLIAILGKDIVTAESEAAGALIERLAGNPLALEIAARRILQNREVAQPIGCYFEKVKSRLAALRLDGDARWDITAIFDISYHDLSAADQKRFRALAVFHPTGFAPSAAAQLWGDERDQAQAAISRLVNSSLLKGVAGKAERYRLHDLLDEYAAPILSGAGEQTAAQTLLAGWLVNLFTEYPQADIGSAPEVGLEFGNLAKTAEWAIYNRKGDLLADLIYWSRNWLKMFSFYSNLLLWSQESIEIGISSPQMKANVLQAIGDVQNFRDERDAALESYSAALKLFRAVGARLGEANVLAVLSRIAIADGKVDEAEQQLSQIILTRRAIRDLYSEGADYGNFAIALLNNGHKEKAKYYALKARVIFEKIELPALVAMLDNVIQASD